MNGIKKVLRTHLKKVFDRFQLRHKIVYYKKKKRNLEEYEDIESDFSQKYLSIKRSLLPSFPQETTINKVIEKISQNSGIVEK